MNIKKIQLMVKYVIILVSQNINFSQIYEHNEITNKCAIDTQKKCTNMLKFIQKITIGLNFMCVYMKEQ